MELKSIKIKAYTTVNDEPTCCKNVRTKETCVFLQSRKFGTTMVCALQPDKLLESYSEYGCLKPLEGCIVWAEE